MHLSLWYFALEIRDKKAEPINHLQFIHERHLYMLSSTYSLLGLSILGLTVFSVSSLAQTITGSGSASGTATVNIIGVFFNAAGANTAANPLAPGNSSNTGSFAGLATGT